MFSRVLLAGTCTVFLISTLGCADYLTGKKAEPTVIEFSNEQLTCLSALPEQLKKLSLGEAVEADIRAGFSCMSVAMNYFNDKTFGSVENGYTTDDMRRFFGKFFLKENNITPEFGTELMKLKALLLGGAQTHITKMEISALVKIFDVLEEEMIQLNPHLKILMVQQSTAEWDAISAATRQLTLSFQRLVERTQITRSDYTLADAKAALYGFTAFARGQDSVGEYENLNKWWPLAEAIKNLLVGRDSHFTSIQQWKDSVMTIAELYGMVLKYHYIIGDFKFENAQKTDQLSDFIRQGLQLVLNTHQMRQLGYIPLSDIDHLIDVTVQTFKVPIRAESFKKVYRAALIKILTPNRSEDTRDLVGLEKRHVFSVMREFNIWSLQQQFINSLSPGLSRVGVFDAYKKFDYKSVIRELDSEPFERNALEVAWNDIGYYLVPPMPVTFNHARRLNISYSIIDGPQSWDSMFMSNFMRALARMLQLGYGDLKGRSITQITLSQQGLLQWYDDFREIGLDMRAFDPRTVDKSYQSFLEANFFSFSGNGDEEMSYLETYEYVSTLFAAGLFSSDALQSGAALCKVEEVDLFDNHYLKGDCFKKFLKDNFAAYFDNMPDLAQYIRGLSPAEWDQFYNYLLSASESPEPREGLIDTANVRTMVTILHYMEGLMVAYDTNRDGLLTLDEVYGASPRFTPFFQKIIGIENKTLLREGFAFVVFRGSIPTTADLAKFQWSKVRGLGTATRMNIIRVIGTLQTQL